MSGAAPAPDPLLTRTILLVDDEPANLDLLETVLEGDGFTSLVRTSDARAALPLFEAARPELVLLDLHMPHRSGFEVLADLRARTAPEEHVPVLVLTADATFAARQRALSSGADDFLTKPFQNAEVRLRVRNLLRTRLLLQAQRRARRTAELLDAASRALHASLDGATAAAQLARLLAGPDGGHAVADGCAIDLADDAGALVRAAHAGTADPGSVDPGGADRGTTAPTPDAPAPAAARLVVPMTAGDRVVGRLVLWRDDPTRPFDGDDRQLAVEVARRAAQAVEHARLYREARAATEAREQVLAVVAHDLRGPLTALRMDAELLQEKLAPGSLRPVEARTLARMPATAARMDALIQDLLDAARMTRGTLPVERAPHDVAALVREAAETLRPLAAAQELALEVEGADAPCVAAVDAGRLLQVIANLVGNAVKFTPAGGRVTLGCAADDAEVRLTVADTGPGLAPEQLSHVFGAFWQARHADRRGLGLGLAIARGIVEAHDGRIWVESAPGRGSTFLVALPRAAKGR